MSSEHVPTPTEDEKIGPNEEEEEKMGPTEFLTKTFVLVEDQTTNEVVSWNEDGISLIIWNPTEFARDVLPKFFKHNNLSSFTRQLNTYGFQKLATGRLEFTNRFFRRGQLSLLCNIQRGKVSTVSHVASQPDVVNLVTPEGSPSNSIEGQSLSNSDLIDENARLKRQIENLNRQVNDMNVFLIDVFNLMWNQTEGGIKKENTCPNLLSGNQVGESSRRIPMEMDGDSKLFGVNISGKRSRMGCEETSEPYDELKLKLQLGGVYHP